MTPSTMQHIPLTSCYLCADEHCRSVGNRAEGCPACANPHVLSLAKVLDREQLVRRDPFAGVRVVWAKGWKPASN